MRERKIRAWDTANKVMLYPEDKEFQNNFTLFAAGNYAYKGEYAEEWLILMDYTGIKNAIRGDGFDKYGDFKTYKRLYEMDIVEFTGHTEFYLGEDLIKERFVICLQADLCAGFCLKHISTFKIAHGCNEAIGGWRPIGPYEFSNLVNHFEVIGNIYENPELLKGVSA